MVKFPVYLYDLPIRVRRELVALLDHGDSWKDVAELALHYDQILVHRFQQHQYQPGTSPSEALLTYLGQRNSTSDDLFVHLNSLGLYRIMTAMQHVVSPSMRHLANQQTVSTQQLQVPLPPPITHSALNKTVDNEERASNRNENLVRLSLSASVTTTGNDESCDENKLTPRVRSRVPSNSSLKTTTARSVSESSGTPMLRNINFDELARACNNFDTPIGRGGFGQVFRGKWNGQDVAVKRILEERRGTELSVAKVVSQAITELNALHAFPAENILPLLAYSYDALNNHALDPICLVYQYMPRGSVADRLRRRGNTAALSWEQRANIALGTARGLRHLHANKIIHGDIKSGNILLDKHFEPKIGDFGLARMNDLANSTETTSKEEASFFMVSVVKGTEAYLPLDYIRSRQLSPAVDTFCFGIFAFELVTAKSPSFVLTTRNEEGVEVRARMRDVMLESSQPEPHVDSALAPPSENRKWSHILFYVGKDCAQKAWRARPPMEQVLDALERLVSQFASPALALQVFYDEQQQGGHHQGHGAGHHQGHGQGHGQGHADASESSALAWRSRRKKESSCFISSVLSDHHNTPSNMNNVVNMDNLSNELDHLSVECLPVILQDGERKSDLIDFSISSEEFNRDDEKESIDDINTDHSLLRLQEVEAASNQLDHLDTQL